VRPDQPKVEVMTEYSFKPWVAARAKRLRRYRLLANFSIVFPVFILIVALLARLFPGSFWSLFLSLFTIVTLVLIVPSFIAGVGFHWGLIKCPSCDSRFAGGFLPFWIPQSCRNCGFNICTLSRSTTSNRRT
jgi:hypothetical protein